MEQIAKPEVSHLSDLVAIKPEAIRLGGPGISRAKEKLWELLESTQDPSAREKLYMKSVEPIIAEAARGIKRKSYRRASSLYEQV